MNYSERQEAKKERLEASAQKALTEARAASESASRKASVIPFGQPILVGHHSEKRDRNFRNSISKGFKKSFELSKKAEHYERRAAAVGTGGISSDDPEAVAKLKEKLEKLERDQDNMKKINALVRKNNQSGIEALGYTAEQAAAFFKPDFCGRVGFPSYALTNNNANIKRIKDRITELSKAAERVTIEKAGNGYKYVENTEENRVMFFFDSKPEKEVREILKKNGFRFSPSRDNAWVRQLNSSGIYAGKLVCERLEK